MKGLTEINEKILAIKEMQNTAVISLNEVMQSVNDNYLISKEEVDGLADSLSSLVSAQNELIGDMKLLMGGQDCDGSFADEYKALLTDGAALRFLAKFEFEKFLTITSDNADFKEAIVKFRSEIEGKILPAKDGYPAGIVSMINRAVESAEEFIKVKTELFNALKSNHSMLYIGLSERGYRFSEEDTAVNTNAEIDDAQIPKLEIVEEGQSIENGVREQENSPVSSDEEKKSGLISVEWTGNAAKIAIKKCLGDFLELDNRTGQRYKTPHYRQLQQLEDLQFNVFITEQTYEKMIGKADFDWLKTKGYISKSVSPVGGFNIIALSKKGVEILNNGTIKHSMYGKEGLKDKQVLISAIEHYKNDGEERILRMLAIGETIASLISSTQYPLTKLIDFSYNFAVLKFFVNEKKYAICLCTDEEITEQCNDAIVEAVKDADSYTILVCKRKVDENGELTDEVEVSDKDGTRFVVKIGGESNGTSEYLQQFFDAEELSTEAVGEGSSTETVISEEIQPIESSEFQSEEQIENKSEELVSDNEAEGIINEEIADGIVEETVTEKTKNDDEVVSEHLKTKSFGAAEPNEEKTPEEVEEYAEESVEFLCKKIIEAGLSPKENVREFYEVAMKLIAENRIWDAIFFLENLAYESDEYKGLSDNLKFIAKVSKWQSGYVGYSEIESAELPHNEYPQLTEAVRLASRLIYLTFFERDDYSVNGRRYQIEDAGVSDLTVPCKTLLNILSKLDIHSGGYTEQDVSAVFNAGERITEFSKKAERLINSKYDGLMDFRMGKKFANDANLRDCLTKIKNKSVEGTETIKKTALEFFDKEDGSDTYVADGDKLDQYLKDIWVKSIKGTEKEGTPLEDPAKTQAFDYLKERVDFINEWLEFQRISSNLDGEKENYRKQIVSTAEKILVVEINDGGNAAANIIKFAAQRIREFLSGKFFDKAWFAPLLYKNEFLLTENFLPEDLSCFATVKGLEPWRSAVRHFSQKPADAESALALIEAGEDRDWLGNNTTHKLLCGYLEKKYEPKIDTVKIKPQAESERKKFEARMEKDFLYGRIDETEKENFFAAERILFHYMVQQHFELGKYKKFLNILTERVDDIVCTLTDEFEKQIAELEKQYPEEPILKNIKSELEKKNFIVVEEYITLLQGGTAIENIQLEREESKLGLENFLDLYDDIYKNANLPKNRNSDFSDWAKKEVKRSLLASPSDVREAEQYLDAWKDKEKIQVEKLISQLGFTVEEVTAAKKLNDCDLIYRVKVSSVPKTLSSYRYPIGAFGTDCKNINVLCFYGENKADRVVKAVEELNPHGTATIVIFNAALNKNRREAILKEFKQTSRVNSFLLIDYVLGFYLALVSKGKRLNALLQCAVPYTGYKLFSDSVDTLLPEMFIGREQEISKITALDDPISLVYGGRQLGKTALFKRACAMMNNPRDGKYAIYVSVAKTQNDSENFFVEKVAEELVRCQLIPKNTYHTNEEICKALRNIVGRPDTESVYLFIDEVNDYFEQLNKRGDTSALNPYVELRRASNMRFKFVLAGLHHVERYSEFCKMNSVVGQMAAPMVVKPLSRMEAIRLIDYPFSYLGIKIDQSFTALIAARANYYPGNIQMICQKIVETVQSDKNGKPPYEVDDKLLETVCGSSEINKEIRRKIDITLGLEPAYKAIAMLFVFSHYENKKNNRVTVEGYSVNQVLEMAKEWERKEVSDLSLRELETLLDELTNMSILRVLENQNDKSIKTYKLRKSSLAEQIATKDEVEKYLTGEYDV